MKKTITIEFDSKKAAEHFAVWLCEAGEQDYWQWMEYREQEEKGNITAVNFDYHGEGDKFIIRTKCGRLDSSR